MTDDIKILRELVGQYQTRLDNVRREAMENIRQAEINLNRAKLYLATGLNLTYGTIPLGRSSRPEYQFHKRFWEDQPDVARLRQMAEKCMLYKPELLEKVPKTSVGGPLQWALRATVLIKHLTPSGEVSASEECGSDCELFDNICRLSAPHRQEVSDMYNKWWQSLTPKEKNKVKGYEQISAKR